MPVRRYQTYPHATGHAAGPENVITVVPQKRDAGDGIQGNVWKSSPRRGQSASKKKHGHLQLDQSYLYLFTICRFLSAQLLKDWGRRRWAILESKNIRCDTTCVWPDSSTRDSWHANPSLKGDLTRRIAERRPDYCTLLSVCRYRRNDSREPRLDRSELNRTSDYVCVFYE